MKFFLLTFNNFTQFFVHFFCHNQLEIRAFESPLDSQRGFAPSVGSVESQSGRFQSFSVNFLTLCVTCVTANNGSPRSNMTY